jgi:hypothetical protein
LHLAVVCRIVWDNIDRSGIVDLPRWLAILTFALIAGGIAHVLRRVLIWRGLTKDQIAWAIFASVMAFILMYIVLAVLGFA